MIFIDLPLADARLIEPEVHEDVRGSFVRTFCARELEEHGLDSRIAQASLSFNRKRGTLRGMHYQAAPHEEVKIVRCVRGSLFDVVIDLRPESQTFMQHVGITLTAENRRALYIPKGFAHGFQTLEDDTEVFYQMSEFHAPGSARGVRWNDPAFGIEWPIRVPIILDRDAAFPDFVAEQLV